MKQRSEGVRRLVFAFSIILGLAVLLFVAIYTKGFSKAYLPNIISYVIVFGIIVLVYLIPQIIAKVIYWIKDGFGSD